MVFYIEYVLLDNFVMNYVILNLIEITTKYKLKNINKFLSVTLGTLLSLILPYIYNNLFILSVFRVILAVIIVLILRKYKSLKIYITYFILFFTYTFLLGGVILGLISMLKIDYTMSGVLLYSFEFPVSIFVLIIFVSIKFIKKLIKKTTNTLNNSKFLYPIKLMDKGAMVDGVGFYDSGNTITVDGDVVNIISVDLFLKLYKDISIDKVLLHNVSNEKLKGVKYISISGLKDNGKYLSFFIDKLLIGEVIYNNVRVAVTLKNFNNFDCILNGNLNVR